MIVYRGQYDKKEITISESKPFFSVTTNPDYAETFASKVWDTENQQYQGIDCCNFKIHLQNVMILNLTDISFERVLKNPPPLVNTDDSKVPILEKFKDLLGAESEILVLGGGSFYTSPECTQKGYIEPPDSDDHQFHETWYLMPIRKNKRKMEGEESASRVPKKGGRTRRFKKHRRMGFTQKARCRPYKNCYK